MRGDRRIRLLWASVAGLAASALAVTCTGTGPIAGPTASGSSPSPSVTATLSAPHRKPDILYLVLDDYGGKRSILDQLGYDNSPFLDALRQRGFYVPDHPAANYPRTSLSLASSLNLDYVQNLLQPAPDDQSSPAPLYDLMERAKVFRFVKSRGYRYIHVGSWWPSTNASPLADEDIRMQGAVGDVAAKLKVPLPQPRPGDPLASFLFERREYIRVYFQFHELAKLRNAKGPKFVFGHILCPHHPFVFDRHGRFVDQVKLAKQTDAQAYTDQVRWLNRKTLHLIDTLLALPPDRRPVIIVQSDEGFYTGLQYGKHVRDDVLERHFSILEAYFFPGLAESGLYPTMTPVNLFRLLFADYFHEDFPLLPDRSYVYPSLKHLYTFIDVTDRVKALT